ncbi:hypothetical protein [Nocardia brevicatena]|uniref:hypothetical protein n=1 Tax=Nocardia brevicatena TaxID=37327 RepID=UPI00031831E6|nr:hypothetical protein [Nocardia brevicatena]
MTRQRLASSDPRHAEVVDFMLLEAELLDDLNEREWLTEMVSRDIVTRSRCARR